MSYNGKRAAGKRKCGSGVIGWPVLSARPMTGA
jgi:hypothetical protein